MVVCVEGTGRGGPLALLKDGDFIRIDAEKGALDGCALTIF
jgi:dihydroxyacid dehydratase/phosphogluconate dehydratase